MVCKIKCAAITGIDTQPVIVETDVCNGLPSFDMVGLLASNIKESRERVRTAIKNSGFMIPPKRITINFSPANIRKTGTYFDQPVAVSILPDMTLEEQIEISKIQSVAGNLSGSLVKTRPVRSPHHTATVSAMIGGGFNPKPGEITQAHGGILFLDELPEFSRQVIETLRQPLEDEKIIVSRSGGTYEFPAKFILIGAMNPCKCGYYPDMNKCTCTEQEVKKYMEKISGPLIDRIDLCVHMNQVTYFQLEKEEQPEDSLTIKERVNRAVQIQRERYANEKFKFNSQLSGENIKKYCKLNKEEQHLMEKIYTTMDLSIRAYDKIIKVARTIADLKQHEKIQQGDIAEAVSYRPVLFK